MLAVRNLGRRVLQQSRYAAPLSHFSTITVDTLPKSVLDCEYAVRGSVLIKGEELDDRLASGEKMAFDKIVPCNIGNPQVVGLNPVTFHRKVIACLAEPSLLDMDVFPKDVRDRAAHYRKGIKDGKCGAYSHSKGHRVFREDIAAFLSRRDNAETDIEDIFITDGASAAVKAVLTMCVSGPKDGVLLPIPQYPLYSATMTLLGGQAVGYFLDEKTGWGYSVSELERAVKEARSNGTNPRAIVVINPGNPTGAMASREDLINLLDFAEREKLAVLADEVYQNNVHVDGKKFISLRSLAIERKTTVEVFSFHSISKGVVGECGLRGGFVHCMNVDKGVMDQMYKLASVNLCSNVLGQAMMASVLTPPPADGPSRAEFDNQEQTTHAALKRKAKMVYDRLNAIDGIECQTIEGAMYAFPKVTIKGYVMKKAISFATPADQIYCLEMVERTGVICVPGSGFGQKPGTFHFRMTILPDEETLDTVLTSLEKFHKEHEHGWFN